MREKLKELNGVRKRFRGRFQKYGIRIQRIVPPLKTLCLQSIEDENGELLADHLWFVVNQRFAEAGEFKNGQLIEFDARVTEYRHRPFLGRPEKNKRPESAPIVDYQLSYPSNIIIVGG